MTESLLNVNKVINDYKSTLDSIQDMVVELTCAIRSMQAVVMKWIAWLKKSCGCRSRIADSRYEQIKSIHRAGYNPYQGSPVNGAGSPNDQEPPLTNLPVPAILFSP